MKTNRSISYTLWAQPVDMGGMPIRQPFPTQRVEQIDPFLLLHHADIEVSSDVDPDHDGVGPHPHRGFSPVTFIFKGGVHHRDSRGHDSVVYANGAQWMNAGMGVIHSERPPQNIQELGGRQEIIQLWINTPAAHKMDAPQYFPVSAEEVPTLRLDEGKVVARIFAGTVLGTQGPIPSHTEINAVTLELKKGGKLFIPLPEDHSAFLYVLNGNLKIEGHGLVEGLNAVVFKKDGDGISLEALEDTRVLLMSGKPLDESVVSHGPFVMNTQTQVLEAMRDYQMGKMGILIED